jgi:drug/metabolite transporter (DMT)-like permease
MPAMRPSDVLSLVLLAAIWGASYLFIRVAAPALGPFPLIDARVLLAGLVLLLPALAAGHLPAMRARWRTLLALGLVNAAAPFSLIAYAELHLTASLTAILMTTAPLLSALVAALWLGERLTARRLAGLLLGIAGVAVLVGWSPLPVTAELLTAAGALLLAALCYGLGAVYSKTLPSAPPLMLATGQQLAAALLLLLPALATLPAAPDLAPPVLGSLLGLAVLSTAAAYLIYFRLIERIGPTGTLSVGYLIPFFGLLWGTVALAEPINAGALAGLAVILLSVALVTVPPRPGAAR